MVEATASPRRWRLGAHGMMFRRRRIFVRLREGWTYEEIAHEEGVTITRIRQIVFAELQQRSVDSGADHTKLQLERLAPAVQLAAEAIAAADVSAITPYLKALDRLDRYQLVASANQVYDDEARKKLMDTINRIASNLGVDEVIAAAVQERLKKLGEIPDDEPGEDEGEGTDLAAAPEFLSEANAPEASRAEAQPGSGFFYLFGFARVGARLHRRRVRRVLGGYAQGSRLKVARGAFADWLP